MPVAGQIIRAADFGGYASVENTTDETNFNSTAFTLGATTVGLTFIAPTSGGVIVLWNARANLNSATGVRVVVSAEVRSGSTIGSGTVMAAAGDDQAVELGQAANTRVGAASHRVVTGLTPGAVYNVALWHHNATSVASAGSIFYRSVTTMPYLG